MKTKEIRTYLQSQGYERGTLFVLESLNEAIMQNARDLKELAHYFDKLVDSMNGMMAVAGAMKSKLEKMEPNEEQLGPNTHSLGGGDQ